MIRTLAIAIVCALALLVLLLVRVPAQQPVLQHLGELHCAGDRDPIWVHVIAHFEGYSTERGLDVAICHEDYLIMTEK